MTRLFQITLLAYLMFFLTGCDGLTEQKPIWQDLKITDLAPAKTTDGKYGKLKDISFLVYFFEIPAENINKLGSIWEMLHTKPFEFNNHAAFEKNSFAVGYSQIEHWDNFRELLIATGGKGDESVSLLIPDGQSSDVFITKLRKQQDVFFASDTGKMEGKTLGPGKIVLRIKAEKVHQQRGVCKVYASPMFTPPDDILISTLASKEKKGEFVFNSTAFKLKMGSGDFFFLAPKVYVDNKITLPGLFFCKTKPEPKIRTILLICTKITR